jgi:hypothetical protein
MLRSPFGEHTPCFSAELMTGLAKWKKPHERMIFILCGAAGLRIGEALGIEIDKHIYPDFLALYIKQKVHHDLHPRIAELLKQFVGDRKTGFLFCTRQGKPVSPHEHNSSSLAQGAGRTQVRKYGC